MGQLRIKSNNFEFDESKKCFRIVVLFGFLNLNLRIKVQWVFGPINMANIKKKIECKTKKLHLLANARDDVVRACICFGVFLKVDFCF